MRPRREDDRGVLEGSEVNTGVNGTKELLGETVQALQAPEECAVRVEKDKGGKGKEVMQEVEQSVVDMAPMLVNGVRWEGQLGVIHQMGRKGEAQQASKERAGPDKSNEVGCGWFGPQVANGLIENGGSRASDLRKSKKRHIGVVTAKGKQGGGGRKLKALAKAIKEELKRTDGRDEREEGMDQEQTIGDFISAEIARRSRRDQCNS